MKYFYLRLKFLKKISITITIYLLILSNEKIYFKTIINKFNKKTSY